MALPWPAFWQHIREEDRGALSDLLAELLVHGAVVGEQGRDRELYHLAREYQRELGEYLAPLRLELVSDPDRPIYLVRPIPGECGLMARFSKAETLLVLTLWRMYHDERMEGVHDAVVVTANEIWHRLRLYFERLVPPTEAQLRDLLGRLRHRRLVRLQWHEEAARFGESQVEILPTLPRVIPFEHLEAWEQHAAGHRSPPTGEVPGPEVPAPGERGSEGEGAT